MSNIINSTTGIFDASPDVLRHDDEDIQKRNVFSGPGYEYNTPSNQSAIDLMMIGILLLLVLIVTGCCTYTILVCKARKQKRLVKPSPEEIMAAVIVHEILQEGTPEVDMNMEAGSSMG
jgi:hypothetical protein